MSGAPSSIPEVERAIRAAATYCPYPRSGMFLAEGRHGPIVRLDVRDGHVVVMHGAPPRVSARAACMGLAGASVLGIIAFSVIGVVIPAIVVSLVLIGLSASVGVWVFRKPHQPGIDVDIEQAIFRSRFATLTLEESASLAFCVIRDEYRRGPLGGFQLIAIWKDNHAGWRRKCVYVGSDLDRILSQLVPFLRAPVYARTLGWNYKVRKDLERSNTSWLPDDTETVDLNNATGVPASQVTRIGGVCYQCGYSLAGVNVPSKCTECGTKFDSWSLIRK